MKPSLLAALGCFALAGCAAPVTPAQRAEDAACNAQASATYNQNTLDLDGRTAQVGQRYSAMPNHVFDAEQMGAQHQFDSQVQQCETMGTNNGQPVVNGYPVVTPHIITN
jgi:hypothetical protein